MYRVSINGPSELVEADSPAEAIEIACRLLGYLSYAHYCEVMGARARVEIEIV